MAAKKRGYLEGITFVESLDKLPPSTHYAILVEDEVLVDDTYGGHDRRRVIKYVAVADKEALDDFILNHCQKQNKTYQVIQVKRVEVKLHTTIELAE